MGSQSTTGITLERILHSQGFGSRRECRQRIKAETVQVSGKICIDPEAVFEVAEFSFSVDGQRWQYRERVYIALNKPTGYECSQAPQHHRSVFSLLPEPLRQRDVQAIGRLDQDTSGLLLLTDDGACNHALSSPRRHVAKTYLAVTSHPLTEPMLHALREGVLLHGETEPLAARDVAALDSHRLSLTISQGKYHQVKRMVAAAGNHVTALHRCAIGQLLLDAPPLDALGAGDWCYLDAAQLTLAGYSPPGATTRISSPTAQTT